MVGAQPPGPRPPLRPTSDPDLAAIPQVAKMVDDISRFLEDWLPGMHEDNVMVGPNWDRELTGLEVEPADIAAHLTT